MAVSSYADRLHRAILKKGNAVCVGLDPRYADLPEEIRLRFPFSSFESQASAYEEFCRRILDVVAPLVPVVKPQAAFFEELGPAGVLVLERVIRRARELGLIVICDAKRNDIGSTATAYARAYLAGEDPQAAPFAADALTVSPYLGTDSLEPFVELALNRGAGIYVLVRTSNPKSGRFQDLTDHGKTFYRHVGDAVEELALRSMSKLEASPSREEKPASGSYSSIGAVVGATYPAQLIELRSTMPHVPFLVPGYGSQGGSGKDVAGAFDAQGLGAIVNSSRGIIFSGKNNPQQWESAVESATRAMIEDLLGFMPRAFFGGGPEEQPGQP